MVGRWLVDAGYDCMNALTPRDARDILRAGAAPTVVILADHFREESGLSFAQRLIQRGRDLGFLFLAPFGSARELGGQRLGLPAERILVKPLSRRNLRVTVDELVLAVEAITGGAPKSLLSHRSVTGLTATPEPVGYSARLEDYL
jgi:CheY-like chemotaxis protein